MGRLGVVINYIWSNCSVLCKFGFRVLLGSFGGLVSKWPVTRKWLAVEQETEIWDSLVVVTCMWGIFDLLVFKVSLGSFDVLVSD